MSAARVAKLPDFQNMTLSQLDSFSPAELERQAHESERQVKIESNLIATRYRHLENDRARLADRIARDNLEVRARTEISTKAGEAAAQHAEQKARRTQHKMIHLVSKFPTGEPRTFLTNRSWWERNKKGILPALLIAITLVAFLILFPLVIL